MVDEATRKMAAAIVARAGGEPDRSAPRRQ
jgi:hypothetical protein